MNDTIRTFLEILRGALEGQPARLDEDLSPEDWHRLLHLATIQNVLPLVYEAVYAHPALALRQELLEPVKQQVRLQVIRQAMRTEEFLQLNDRLLAAGVRPLVVKGLVCRSLYPKPDHRPSSDEDVLIRPEAFACCHQVLTEFGMATEASREGYEVPYRKAGSPLYIELHKSLFPPEQDAYGDLNRFFEGAVSRSVEISLQGHRVYTMEPTDHLFYLICHAFKHFLHSGFGIRQVCDIVLFARRYGGEVDWQRIRENCRAIRAEQFAGAIFALGDRYLGITLPAAWQDGEVDPRPLLQDLLEGGLYGDASMSRKHSSNITLDAVAAQKSGRKAKSGWLVSAFPAKKKLEGRYPYLKKHPYLLPVAWCSRLLRYGQETRRVSDNHAAQALKIGQQRVELLKFYGIIE